VKLEGSLDAFGLPDIFQLLSFTKKTGGLHLRGEDSRGVVYFAAGSVTGACADIEQLTLVRRLIGSGTVSDASLEAAVARALAEGVGLARALSDAGALDSELLKQAATEQAVDAVYDLLRWPAGDFAFSVDESNPDDVGVVLPTDRLVTEAQSRTTAFDQALALVPVDSVLVMPVVLADDPALTRDEWALIALVDGQRTVGELVDLTGAGLFAVLSTLADLVGRELLSIRDPLHDHASVVRRRLALLAPLETVATEPVETETEPVAPPVLSSPSTTRIADPPANRNGGAPAARSSFALGVSPAAPNGSAAASAASSTSATAVTAVVPAASAPAAPAAPAAAAAPADAAVATATVVNAAEPMPEAPVALRNVSAPPAEKVSTAQGATGRLGLAPDPFHGTERPSGASAHSGSTSHAGSASHTGSSAGASAGGVNGSAAMAAEPVSASVIERDPSVNRSLLLRLIAGVRGL
jgi:hypothetical protein